MTERSGPAVSGNTASAPLSGRTVKHAGACFLIALAAQTDNAVFFRALLDQASPMLPFPFDLRAVCGLINDVNGLLGGGELWVERSGGSILLIKSSGGMIVKIENKGGSAIADSCYSYPSNRFTGKETFRIGRAKIYSSRQTMERMNDYIAGGAARVRPGFPALGKGGRGEKVELRACIRAFLRDRQVTAAKKGADKTQRAAARLKAAYGVTAVACYLMGTFLVQAGCVWLFGEPVVTFMAFFLCCFAGMLLNHAANEFVLPICIRRYRQKQRYGDEGRGGNSFIMAYVSNAALYMASLFFVRLTTLKMVELLLGLIFTFYSMHYLVNVLFAMKRHVLNINAGKTPLNTRYYANTALPPLRGQDMPAVTINLTVYTEDNGVIFNTMQQALAAVADYRRRAGVNANLLVSDDGFFKFLNSGANPGSIGQYMKRWQEGDVALTEKERMILERIAFYRQHGIAFVARPLPGRSGKFKKGGNMNYTCRLAWHLARGRSREELLAAGGMFYGGYFEGEVAVNDIILILDKDSGLHPGILYATVPEFVNDPKLAYTQHKTVSANTGVNYFTKAMSAFLNTLFNTHLPNKALQGLVVPLMGHNAFVRRSFIEESRGWSEGRVAEDFSKSLDAYRLGYHGKFIAYKGMDFSEHVCQTFAEETEKQCRYCYGVMEMVFKDYKKHVGHYLLKKPYDNPAYQRLKPFQMMDVFTYFLSYINLAASVPTALFIISGTYIHILYGGILINLLIFFVGPVLQSAMFRIKSRDRAVKASPLDYAIINFNFFGQSYSVLKGIAYLIADSVRGKYEPFASSNVDCIENSFTSGVKTIARYSVRNFPYTIAALVLAAKGVTLLLSGNMVLAVTLPAVYLISFLFPILLLTPQVFGSPFRSRRAARFRKRGKTQ